MSNHKAVRHGRLPSVANALYGPLDDNKYHEYKTHV